MPTLADLIDEVISNTQGFTAAPDQVTFLVGGIDAVTTKFTVNDATNISRGLIEVGSELMWVASVDTSTNTLTLLPKGRGWRGSVAAAHSDGDTVTISPNTPRYIVKRELNNELNSIYPDLFGVKTTEFTLDSVIQVGWPLPADAEGVLDVRWKDYLGNWQRVRGWELERSGDTADFPSGTSLRITERIPVSRTIQVVYSTQPVGLVNDTDDFTLSGLPLSSKDVITLGAIIRMLPMLDISRLSVQYVPAEELSQPNPMGSASALVRDLKKTYDERLLGERTILALRYPARIHFTR